jgi:hypothetical protein
MVTGTTSPPDKRRQLAAKYGLEKLLLIPSVSEKQETFARDPTGSVAMYTTSHSSENTLQDIKPTKADIDEAHSQHGFDKTATKVDKQTVQAIKYTEQQFFENPSLMTSTEKKSHTISHTCTTSEASSLMASPEKDNSPVSLSSHACTKFDKAPSMMAKEEMHSQAVPSSSKFNMTTSIMAKMEKDSQTVPLSCQAKSRVTSPTPRPTPPPESSPSRSLPNDTAACHLPYFHKLNACLLTCLQDSWLETTVKTVKPLTFESVFYLKLVNSQHLEPPWNFKGICPSLEGPCELRLKISQRRLSKT